ncbi:MAG: hypothetical protein ACWA5P_13095, partial [bacterium]
MFFRKLLIGILLIVGFASVVDAKKLDCSEKFAPISVGDIVTFVPYISNECRMADAIEKMARYADSGGTTNAPTVDDYKAIGVKGVTSANVGAVNTGLASITSNYVKSGSKFIAFVNQIISSHYKVGKFDGVKGVLYKTSSGLSGVTGDDGNYKYHDGDDVTFYVGEVNLGTVKGSGNIDSFSFNKPLLVSQILHSFDKDADFTNGFDLSGVQDNLRTEAKPYRAYAKNAYTFKIDNVDAYDKKYVKFLQKYHVKSFPGMESLKIDYLEKIRKKFNSNVITDRPTPSAAKQAMYGIYKFSYINNNSIKAIAKQNYLDTTKDYNYRLNVAAADRLYVETIQKIANASTHAVDEIETMKKRKEKLKAKMELYRSNIFAVLKTVQGKEDFNKATNELLKDIGSNGIKYEIEIADNERYKPEMKLAATILLDATRIKNTKDVANTSIDVFKSSMEIFIRDKFSEEYPVGSEIAKSLGDIVLDDAKIATNCNAKSVKKDPIGCADVVSSVFLDKSLDLVTTPIQINALNVDQKNINNMKVALELMMSHIYTKNDYCTMLDAYNPGKECSNELSKYGIITILAVNKNAAEALINAVVDSGDVNIYRGPFTFSDVDNKSVYKEYQKLVKRIRVIKAEYNKVFSSLEIGDGQINDDIADRIVESEISRSIKLTQTFNYDNNSIDFKACLNLYSKKEIQLYSPEISLISDSGNHKFILDNYNTIFRGENPICGKLKGYKPDKDSFDEAKINNISSYPFLIEATSIFRHKNRETKNYNINDRNLYNLSIHHKEDTSNDGKASVKVTYELNDNFEYQLSAFLNDDRVEAENVKKYIYNWEFNFPGCSDRSIGDALESNSIKIVVPEECRSRGVPSYILGIYDDKNHKVIEKSGSLETYDIQNETELSLSVNKKTIVQSGEFFTIPVVVNGGTRPYDITFQSPELLILKNKNTGISRLKGYGSLDSSKSVTVSILVNDAAGNSITKDVTVEISKIPSVSINWASGYTKPFVPIKNKPIPLKVGDEITQTWGIINTSDIKLYGVTLKWDAARSSTSLEHSKADIYVGDMDPRSVKTPHLTLKRLSKSLNIDEGYYKVYYRKNGKLVPIKFPNLNQIAYVNYKFYTPKDITPVILGKVLNIYPKFAKKNTRKVFSITGTNFPKEIAVSIQDCDTGETTWLSPSKVIHSCIPRGTGTKKLYAATTSGGTRLTNSGVYTIQVEEAVVVDNKPTIRITTSGS